MEKELRAVVTLQGDSVLTGKAHTPHEVRIDYVPPLGGDDGFMPLELLMVSLAGCSLHTVLFMLRKMGRTVDAMEVHASGRRRSEHPTVITEISLRYDLRGDGLDRDSVEKAIRMSEEEYCPAWAMLKSGTSLSSTYTISKSL